MAKHLRLRNSKLPLEKNNPGCMWGIFHFFNFHQRLHIRKTLSNRRLHEGRRVGGIEVPRAKQNVPPNGKEQDFLDREANFLLEDKVNATVESLDNALIRTPISEEMYQEQDQEKRKPPSASRLLRTLSIHYLECNDYVRPNEMTSISEAPIDELHSHSINSAASAEHLPQLPTASDELIFGKQCEEFGTMNPIDYVDHNEFDDLGNHLLEKQALLQEKLIKAKDVLLKQKTADVKELGREFELHQLKDFLELLELFNVNRELFLEILQDRNSALTNHLRSLQASSTEIVLTKSGSFPGAGLSERKSVTLFEPKKQQKVHLQTGNLPPIPYTINSSAGGALAVASMAGGEECFLKADPGNLNTAGTGTSFEFSSGSPHELKNKKDDKNAKSRFQEIKQRIKGIIKESRKEHHRISMDGILHKIPYGNHELEDVVKEKVGMLEKSASDRYDRDSPRNRLGSDGAVSANSKYLYKSIRRSRSLTESIGRYSHLLESNSSRESSRLSERLKLVQEDGGLQVKKSPKTLGRIFSLPEFQSSSITDVQTEVPHASSSFKTPGEDLEVGNTLVDTCRSNEPKSVVTIVHPGESMEADGLVNIGRPEDTSQVNALETTDGGPGQPVLTNNYDGSEERDVSGDLLAEGNNCISLYEEIGKAVNLTDKPEEPSPISVLDTYFQEDIVSPVKYCVSEAGSELKPRCIHFEELDVLADPQNQFDVDVSKMETITADFDEVQFSRELTDFDAFSIQVDQKDEAKFNYVRDILSKSAFSGEEFLGAWYSPNHPVDPSPHELDIANDTSFDHQLLFDLVNEVLLEIYDSSFAHCLWISHFDSCVRPIPVGYHVLEGVWKKISWHLSAQQLLDPNMEYVVARDFSKNDGWMNLRHDTELEVQLLEGLILDDLLHEVILAL